ncbi:unnamed protein product [Mytilus coruscus]|uniref:Uncharacterized protein n=1 Tax=Mytilus coruscus TaxID=42192 RepID=A0A6J8A724_MYTCO|nr:unnamed protein product [Mytilus coruscus]
MSRLESLNRTRPSATNSYMPTFGPTPSQVVEVVVVGHDTAEPDTVVNLSTQNGSIELWTNTDSIMVEIKDGMEKRLLSTILLFSFAELLEEMVQQLSKKFCQGCKVEHGSQHRHDCLMDSELDKLEKHFEQAYWEFKYSHILGKYRENVRTWNLENSVLLNFFILHVFFLDTLRSEKMKETVYNLMERKVKLEGRFTE